MSVVRVEHVSKDYRLGDQIVRAINDISLAVETGVFLAISGPSGSGKTTLLNLIGCIDRPTAGNVYIDEQPAAGMSDNQLAALRLRSIGFIFQTFNLLPVLTAEPFDLKVQATTAQLQGDVLGQLRQGPQRGQRAQ